MVQLSQWGYPVPACVEALQRLKGNSDAAHQDIFARLAGETIYVCSTTAALNMSFALVLFGAFQLACMLTVDSFTHLWDKCFAV